MTANWSRCLDRCSKLICLTLLLGLAGCGTDTPRNDSRDSIGPVLGQAPFDLLSEYQFFKGAMHELAPAAGVIPYQVISPLWADHAGKARFIVLPTLNSVDASTDEDWAFPEDTVIIKNFFYSQDRRNPDASVRVIETRLMVREGDDWTGHTYVWNAEQTDAERRIAGTRVHLEIIDEQGEPVTQEYIVPNTNQCKDCHEIHDKNRVLGLVSRQLGRQVLRDGTAHDQMTWLTGQNLFSVPPSVPEWALVAPFGDAALVDRARSYLDSNCGHCHRDGGNGGRSGLVLLASERDPTTFGVCKSPIAAGGGSGDRHHDIVPGHPEKSILVYRMQSTDPEVKMPEIPNRLPHSAGVALISDWIRNMDGPDCQN